MIIHDRFVPNSLRNLAARKKPMISAIDAVNDIQPTITCDLHAANSSTYKYKY
jgi:hypothetical protein